jgi:hypothetical protein
MPKPLTDSIETKFTNEPLCEKLKAYSDGEIQFTDVSLYGESILAWVQTAKDEHLLLQIQNSSSWNSAIESISSSILAMGFTEEEASRRIETKNTICFYQIFINGEIPRMWTFNYAGRFVATLQPISNYGVDTQTFFASMDRICDILNKLTEVATF